MKKRYIYAYEFDDNHIYVGLTWNLTERKNKHKKEGSVFNHSKKTKLTPTFINLTKEPVICEEAVFLENYYLQQYINNGWIPLNKVKTGSLGGTTIKWNYDECLKEALKFETRKEFCLKSGSAYSSSLKNKWIDSICEHMDYNKKCISNKNRKPNNYWTVEVALEIAKEFKSISELKSKFSQAYYIIRKNNKLEYLHNIYKIKKRPKNYWTLEKCIEVAKKCKSASELKNKYGSASCSIYKNKWAEIVKKYYINS